MSDKAGIIESDKSEKGSILNAAHGQFVGTPGVCEYKCEAGDLTLQFGPGSFIKQRLVNAKITGYTQKKVAEALEYDGILDNINIRYELFDHHAKDVVTVLKSSALNNLHWILETSDDIVLSVIDGRIVIDSKAFNITDDPAYPTKPYCRLAEIEPPVVMDVNGTRLDFEYKLSGNSLKLVSQQKIYDWQYPLTVDPAYTITSLSKAESTTLIWSSNLKRLFAIWVRDVAGYRHCYISYSDNGGINWTQFGTAVSSGFSFNGGMTSPNAILDANGIMHIFFGAYPQGSTTGQLYYRRFNPATMQYVDGQAIKLTNEAHHNSWNNLDLDSDGRLHVAVIGRWSSTGCYIARYVSFDPDSFSAPLALTNIGTEYTDSGGTAGYHSYGGTLVVDSNGDLHMAWHMKNAETAGTYQTYYRRYHGGTWEPIVALTTYAQYPHTAQLVRLFEDAKTGEIMLLFFLARPTTSIHALMNVTRGTTELVYDSGYSHTSGGILYQYPNGNLALLYSGYSQQYPAVGHLRMMHRVDGIWRPDQQMHYTASGPVQVTSHPFDRTRYGNAKMRALAGALCNYRFTTGSSNCFKTDNFTLAARKPVEDW